MEKKKQDKILEEARKDLQKFMKSDLKRATRLSGPQLANEYNKLLKENEELKEHLEIEQGRNKELKNNFQGEQSQRKYFEDTANELKKVIEEKEAIIQIQSMNNRVLLEEIIRSRKENK